MSTQWSNMDSTASPTPWTGNEPTKENSTREFARAKTIHPQGGGETNEAIQDRRAVEAKEKQNTLARTKEQEKSKEVKDNYRNTVLAEKSRELKQTIGQAGEEVIGRVNKFLNEGRTKIDNLSSAQTVYNEETGRWEISDVSRKQGFDTLAQEKYQELQRLRETADTFFVQNEQTGQWEPRKFSDVIADHYNSLDTDSRMQVDSRVSKLMSLAEKINRLEQLNQGDSVEANSLRRQLALEDRDGVVSGLYEARNTVKDLLEGNISFSGDEGSDSRKVGDILNLGLDEIRSELEKAAASSSGLFGGDYSAAIKNALDKDSEDYAKFVNEEVFFKNTLANTGKQYFNDIQTRLMGMATDIQSSLKNVAPDLQRVMQFDPTLQGDSELLQTVFAGLDGGDPEDFAGFINDMLFDPSSGLALNERHKLAGLIGDVMKQQGIDLGDLQNDALISNAMDELSETGTFSWVNEDGTEKRLQPNGGQKALILHAANQGPAELAKVFKDIVNGTGIDLEKTIADLSTSKGYTALPMVVEGFMENTLNSFRTFKGSDSEKIVMNAALQATPGLAEAYTRGEVSEADMNATMVEFIKQNPGIAQDLLKQTWDNSVKQNEVQAREIQKQIAQLKPAYEATLQKIAETSKDVLEKEAKITEWLDSTRNNLRKDIADNYALAEAAFMEQDFAGVAAAHLGWSRETLNARLPPAIKGLASMSSLVKIQMEDSELYSLIEKQVKSMESSVTNKTLKEIIKNFNPASMQESGRDNFMQDILGSGTGATLAAIIDKALGKAVLTHPQVLAAKEELQTAKMSLAKSQGDYSKGLQQLAKQEALLKELSQKTNEMNILTPKNIVKTAANMARALAEDGVSATPPVFQGSAIDMGGTGQRGKIPGKLDSISGVTSPIHQGVQGDWNLKNVSGKLDSIKGFEGDLSGYNSINRVQLDKEGAMDIGQVQDIKIDEQPPGGWSTTGANGGAMSGKMRVNNQLVEGYYYKDPKTGNTTFYANTTSLPPSEIAEVARGISTWLQSKPAGAGGVAQGLTNLGAWALGAIGLAATGGAPDKNLQDTMKKLNEIDNKYKDTDPAKRQREQIATLSSVGENELKNQGWHKHSDGYWYKKDESGKLALGGERMGTGNPKDDLTFQASVGANIIKNEEKAQQWREKSKEDIIGNAEKNGEITPEQAKELREGYGDVLPKTIQDAVDKKKAEEAKRKQAEQEAIAKRQKAEEAKRQEEDRNRRDYQADEEYQKREQKAVDDYNKKLREQYGPNAAQVQ